MLPRFQSKFNLPYVATAFGVHHFQVEGQVKSVRHVKATLSTQCHQQERRSQLTSAHQGISSKHRLLDRFLCIWSNDIIYPSFFLFVCPLEFSQIFYKRILAESIWLDPIQVPNQTKRVHKRKNTKLLSIRCPKISPLEDKAEALDVYLYLHLQRIYNTLCKR